MSDSEFSMVGDVELLAPATQVTPHPESDGEMVHPSASGTWSRGPAPTLDGSACNADEGQGAQAQDDLAIQVLSGLDSSPELSTTGCLGVGPLAYVIRGA